MPEPRKTKKSTILEDEFSLRIKEKEARMLQARARRKGSAWFGLGMFGIIGWSVVIPALLGVAVGIWIDRNFPSRFSWTLMLLLLGIILGSLNAWHWVSQERKNIEKEK
jgi:ATP synthase protein I